MEKLFVFKAVARDGKLQLCVSIKGMSAAGRSYRVINAAHPDLSLLGKNGEFTGGSLASSANKAIRNTLMHANKIVEMRSPGSIKEFLLYFDNNCTDSLTVGEYVSQCMNEQRYPKSGRMVSNGWRGTQNILRKLQALGVSDTQMANVDNSFYVSFCNKIRSGEAPDTFHKNTPLDCGCHGYRSIASSFKTILNKAFVNGLIGEKITYRWGDDCNLPTPTEGIEHARMNVPTDEEWEKFLKADLRRYTYSNRDIHKLELMRSVIIVLVETLSRPSDVLSMRKEDISNMSWSYVPKKFKQKPISFKRSIKKPIGLTRLAYSCIVRNWNKTDSGYVFPFQCNMVDGTDEEKYIYLIGNMGSKINAWLKLLTNTIFSKDMSMYSFRHYAITRAINRGLNVAEVATLAKTSIQQINSTYYERNGMESMEKLEKLLTQ